MYGSHDLEDIIFVLDQRDEVEEELLKSDVEVKDYLKKEFNKLLKNKSFEEALIGHVEQSGQIVRKDRIVKILTTVIDSW